MIGIFKVFANVVSAHAVQVAGAIGAILLATEAGEAFTRAAGPIIQALGTVNG